MSRDPNPQERDLSLRALLGQLTPDEEAQLAGQLRDRPDWQADLDADARALTALAESLDLSDVEVPEDASARLLARVRQEGRTPVGAETDLPLSARLTAPDAVTVAPEDEAAPGAAPVALPPRRPRAWWPLGLGLAAALLLAVLIRPGPADPGARYAAVHGAVQQPVQAQGEALGTVIRLPDGRVFVHLTRTPEEGRTYQLWSLAEAIPQSLGVFGDDGLLTAALPAGAPLAVTVEPAGGSPGPTTPPILLPVL